MTETLIRDNLFEREELADVLWPNCRECGAPLFADWAKRSVGFCGPECQAKDVARNRTKKLGMLRRLLGIYA